MKKTSILNEGQVFRGVTPQGNEVIGVCIYSNFAKGKGVFRIYRISAFYSPEYQHVELPDQLNVSMLNSAMIVAAHGLIGFEDGDWEIIGNANIIGFDPNKICYVSEDYGHPGTIKREVFDINTFVPSGHRCRAKSNSITFLTSLACNSPYIHERIDFLVECGAASDLRFMEENGGKALRGGS